MSCRARLLPMALVVGTTLTACGGLSPQVFPPHLDPPGRHAAGDGNAPAADAQACTARGQTSEQALDAAICNNEALQRRYIDAALELSRGNAGTAAALIALATGTAVKAAGGLSSADGLGVAAAAGGLYTYGTTMLPRTRSGAYLAGVQALACAATAARASQAPGLAHDRQAAMTQLETLSQALAQLRAWGLAVDETRPAAGTPAACAAGRPACVTPNTRSDTDLERHRELCAAQSAAFDRRCTPTSATTVRRLSHPAVGQVLQRAGAVQASLMEVLAASDRMAAEIGQAPDILKLRTTSIALAVSVEVAKTEPDLMAIKAALGDFTSGGASVPTPAPEPVDAPAEEPAGKSQSDSKPAAVQAVPEKLNAVSAAVEKAAHARNQLLARLRELDSRLRRVHAQAPCAASLGPRTEVLRADEPVVAIDDALRQRLAPLLGLPADLAGSGLAREVDRALDACQRRGLIASGGGSGNLSQASLTAVVLGRCTATP